MFWGTPGYRSLPMIVATFEVGDLPPIVAVDPGWPREAILQPTDGWVEVEFTILGDGSVANPEVLRSEPPRLFDRSALEAILRWRFAPPGAVNDETVSRRAVVRIDFSWPQ